MISKKKDLKYFMREEAKSSQTVTAPGPDTITDEDGNVLQLEIRVLSQKQIQDIYAKYHRKIIATDKHGQPFVVNGEAVYKVEKDNARAFRHLIAEALVYPDLHSDEMMSFFDCHDISEMPLLVFPRADEYAHVGRMVMAALGMTGESAATDSEELEDAKN